MSDPIIEEDLISQDDIDQLMNSNPGSGESLPVSDDDEEFEELSQDDIKALMGAQDKKNDEENPIRQDDFVINEDSSLSGRIFDYVPPIRHCFYKQR